MLSELIDSLGSSVYKVIAKSLSSVFSKHSLGKSLILIVLFARCMLLDFTCFLAVDETLLEGLCIVVKDFLFDWHMEGLYLTTEDALDIEL